jgi:hypothetical protein
MHTNAKRKPAIFGYEATITEIIGCFEVIGVEEG